MTEQIEVAEQSKEVTDLEQTNGQIPYKAYHYKMITGDTNSIISVLAPSSSTSREGLRQQFPGATFTYMGKSTTIIQFNG